MTTIKLYRVILTNTLAPDRDRIISYHNTKQSAKRACNIAHRVNLTKLGYRGVRVESTPCRAS